MRQNTIFGKFAVETEDVRERARLEALDKLDLLDTPQEQAFDRIAGLITTVFQVEMSVVSLIDGHRQWYKSSRGVGACEVERRDTFCKHTIEGTAPLVVRDASTDPLFANHPAVKGGIKVRFYAGAPIRTRSGHNIGTICAFSSTPRTFSAHEEQTLEELAQLTMDCFELNQVAVTDGLTGALTRRAFKTDAGRAIALAARQKANLACLTFDLDRFKSINDRFGHGAGDEVLTKVANVVQASLRESDLFGRLGGEEFAVILPDADQQGALAVANKIRQAISEPEFVFGTEKIHVTASFGISTSSLVTRDLDTLLANADAALYRAKTEGRDRCCVWQSASGVQRRVLKAGQIVFNTRRSSIDCTVKSIGDHGAALSVSSTAGIPSEFTLVIRGDNFESECKVISVTDRNVDVSFS